jgi:hypothetical protein
MIKLNYLVNDCMKYPYFNMDLLIRIVKHFYDKDFFVGSLKDKSELEKKLRGIDGDDVETIEIFDDNLNEIYSNFNKPYPDIFKKYVGFRVSSVSSKFYVPIACYVGASYKGFTPDNITSIFGEIEDQNNKSLFIDCLKINNNIRRKKTKLFIELL